MTGENDAGSSRRSDHGRPEGAPEAVLTAQAFDYLSGMPHFSFVSEEERKAVSDKAAYKGYPEGHVFAVQGQTEIQDIFVVVKGSLSLYDGGVDDKRLIGHIKPGEVFGGISILLNGGVSLRTVVVDRDCSGICHSKGDIPGSLHPQQGVLRVLSGEFQQPHLRSGPGRTSSKPARPVIFWPAWIPFPSCPRRTIDPMAGQLSMVHYPKGTVLFVQGRSRVGYLYILQKGSAERYYEEGRKKTMSGMLGEGDVYGGISMLLNDGMSVRTLKVMEDAYFYLLPKQQFLDICARNEAFTEYFHGHLRQTDAGQVVCRRSSPTRPTPRRKGRSSSISPWPTSTPQNPAFGGMDA